ncbi:MAG: cadherin-like beta sandwich domain-containing protein [Oscillospiraceae bacterium]
MKKKVAILSSVILLIALILPISASSLSKNLTCSNTIRQGDTISIGYVVNGTNISGGQGDWDYDSSQVEYLGTTGTVSSPWMVEENGNRIIFYDNALSAPINSSTQIFYGKFRVKAPAGTSIKVSFTNAKVSEDGTKVDGSAALVRLVAAPVVTTTTQPASKPSQNETQTPAQKGGNANLSSLQVEGVTLSPAFNPSVTKYTASVDFGIEKLSVKGSTEDPSSKVSIGSTKLAVGTNNIRIKVTATGGATKTYTLSVTRAQDPNAPTTEAATTQKLNANTKLSAISVEGFLLSPAFDSNKTDYIVWLPYETESINVVGTPGDAKSTVKVEGNTNLVAGKANEIKITCTAEDGTKAVYTIKAMRAPLSGVYNSDSKQAISSDVKSGTPAWLTILLCLIFLAIGAGVCYLILKRKNGNNYDGPDDDNFNGGNGPDNGPDSGPDSGLDDNLDNDFAGASHSKFRGIFIPSTPPTGGSTKSFSDDVADEAEAKQEESKFQSTPPKNIFAQAPVTPTPPYEQPATPVATPSVQATPVATPSVQATPVANAEPPSKPSFDLPYQPAGVTQKDIDETQQQVEPQQGKAKRVIKRNPFEMSADE